MTDFLHDDCETCPRCKSEDSFVVYRRRILGMRERRHECRVCGKDYRWNTYQSFLDPRKVTAKLKSLPVEIAQNLHHN